MRNPFTKLTYLGAIFLLLIAVQGNQPHLASQYCNDRFGYCLDYPTSLFAERHLSKLGDTLLLTSAGRMAEITVVGKLGAAKNSPEEVFGGILSSISSKDGKANVISSLFAEEFYEANFLCGDYTYHQKAGFSNSRWAVFTLKVRMNRHELMESLKSDIEFVFE